MTILSICPAPGCNLAMYLTDLGAYYCKTHGVPPHDAQLVLFDDED